MERTNATCRYYVRFTSPKIPVQNDMVIYKALNNYFSSLVNQKCAKLFINYREQFGKVYYPIPEILDSLIKGIKENNIYSLEVESVELEGMFASHVDSSPTSPANAAVAVVSKVLYDSSGQKVPVFDGDDEQYIAIKNSETVGCKLFETPEDAEQDLLHGLETFLKQQSEVYLSLMNIKKQTDIIINIRTRNTANASTTSSSKMGHGFNSNNYSNGIAKQRRNTKQNNTHSSDRTVSVSPTSSVASNQSRKNIIKKMMSNSRNSSNESKKSNLNCNSHAVNSYAPSTALSLLPKSLSKSVKKLCEYPKATIFTANLKSGTMFSIQILSKLTTNSFIGFGIVPDFIALECILTENLLDTELLIASVGDMVIVQLSGNRISRAYVLEILEGKFKVAALEYGKVVLVDKVFDLPSECKNFEEFICHCETTEAFLESISVDDGIQLIYKNYGIGEETTSNTMIKITRWVPEEYQVKNGNKSLPEAPLPKTPQKIYTTIPTFVPPAKMFEKVKYIGIRDGILLLRTKDLNSLIKDMNTSIVNNNLEMLEKPPTVGQYVLQKFGNEYMRCLVKNVSGNGVLVEHIDYFRTGGTLSNQELYNFVSKCAFGPTLLPVRLRYFEERQFSPAALKHLASLTQKAFEISYLADDVVDLLNDNKVSLSNILMDLDKPKWPTMNDLPKNEIAINEKFQLLISSFTQEHLFYFIATPEMRLQFSECTTMLSKISDLKTLDDIEVGQLGLVLFEEEWNRVEVLEVNGDKAKVNFFDFGNIESKHVQEIYELPKNMLQFGPFAIKAELTQDSLHYGNYAATEAIEFEGILKKKGDIHQLKLLSPVG